MSRPLYRLEDVQVCRGGREILRLDRLAIERGELLCVVGPTGAGKTTLLRLLASVEAPTAGRVHFEAHALVGPLSPEVQRRITLVFQRPLLLSGTVCYNVEYGLRVRGRRDRDVAVGWLRRLGLETMARQRAGTLSGGESQLVALARALALGPEVLLLDEPTANLDPARVGLVEEVIREVHAAGRTTVVLVTHNLGQARRLARRVALLLDGRLVEEAPAAEFFAAPRDPRCAAFVRGEMVY